MPDEPVALVSAGTFRVYGHKVFAFKGVPGLNPRDLQRRPVVIDGTRYEVVGVETEAIDHVTGHAFALMVAGPGRDET